MFILHMHARAHARTHTRAHTHTHTQKNFVTLQNSKKIKV